MVSTRGNSLHFSGSGGSILISERGIYAASTFKAIRALKRAKARVPLANQDITVAESRLTDSAAGYRFKI
jgi:hypothetical protein